jgi:hypothetical protein
MRSPSPSRLLHPAQQQQPHQQEHDDRGHAGALAVEQGGGPGEHQRAGEVGGLAAEGVFPNLGSPAQAGPGLSLSFTPDL